MFKLTRNTARHYPAAHGLPPVTKYQWSIARITYIPGDHGREDLTISSYLPLRDLVRHPVRSMWFFERELRKLRAWKDELFQGTADLTTEIKFVWRDGGLLGRSLLVVSVASLTTIVSAFVYAVAVVLS